MFFSSIGISQMLQHAPFPRHPTVKFSMYFDFRNSSACLIKRFVVVVVVIAFCVCCTTSKFKLDMFAVTKNNVLTRDSCMAQTKIENLFE